jgi:hypothetical protein
MSDNKPETMIEQVLRLHRQADELRHRAMQIEASAGIKQGEETCLDTFARMSRENLEATARDMDAMIQRGNKIIDAQRGALKLSAEKIQRLRSDMDALLGRCAPGQTIFVDVQELARKEAVEKTATGDPETSAMSAILVALARLPMHVRRRIVEWLFSRIESDSLDTYGEQVRAAEEACSNAAMHGSHFVIAHAEDGRIYARSSKVPAPGEVR